MKKLLLLIPFILMIGCSTTPKSPYEEKAKIASEWVAERSGFIEVAVQTSTHIIIYSVEKDSEKRAELLAILNTVSTNLNTLISEGKVDPMSVRNALKVKEEYVGTILSGVASIYTAEYSNIQKNGYANLAIEILKAVSRGVANGTIQ